MRVEPVGREACRRFVLDIHYARRWPSITYAFGLFTGRQASGRGTDPVGVVTFGTPPSSPLRAGVAGPDYRGHVLELNRLCLLDNGRNEASFLVAAGLRALPASIVVAFADPDHGHTGYVYQACNFLYCGLSAKRTDWRVAGREHLHGYTVADEFRGEPNRAERMRERYGDRFYTVPRPRKHRYVTFVGDRRFRRAARRALRYAVLPYPKA